MGSRGKDRENDRIGKQRERTTRRITGYAGKAEIQEGAGHEVQCAGGSLHRCKGQNKIKNRIKNRVRRA